MPCLAASAFMLAVSARRQGLLLAFWLKATLKPDFLASFGALSAGGTPAGASELPGSAASTSGHAPPDPLAAGALPLSLPPQPTSRPTDRTPTPASVTIFLRSTNPSNGDMSQRRQGRELNSRYQDVGGANTSLQVFAASLAVSGR